jgi:hypothetical protein
MSRFKNYILIVFLTGAFANSFAQVTVNFNTALYGRSLDGLSFCQIINPATAPVYAKTKITITEVRVGLVATVQVPYIQLKPGMNLLNSRTYSQSSFLFSNSPFGKHLSSTGKLSEGDYEFCFEVTTGDPKTQAVYDVTENCFQSLIEPLTPLLLIDPIEGEKSCNTRPNFTWQPPFPVQRNTQFRIIVCEKAGSQTAIEAITYNEPVLNISGLHINTIFYPAKTPDLKKDHSYVWQVTAYQDKTLLTKSEIWQFEIKCDDEKRNTNSDSYRELKESEDGNFYLADKILRISLYNPYNPGSLNYSITSLSDPEKKIKKLPELKLNTGLNKYEIDLSENSSFKNGQEYEIKVGLENNRTLRLRFIYQNAE